jgi:hypothetical protein
LLDVKKGSYASAVDFIDWEILDKSFQKVGVAQKETEQDSIASRQVG